MLKSLSITFPCYNEAANVGSMIEQAIELGEKYQLDYEVVVVDDGSKDDSARIVREWCGKNQRVVLVQHPHNQGYGAAVRTALKSAKKEFVFFTDGDNQFRPSDIEKLFSKMSDADIVVGYRISRQDKSYRRVNGFLWTWLSRVLFGLPVRDVDCAFKLFPRKALENLEPKANHLLIHAEILARLKRRGYTITEVGIPHYPRTAGQATATRPAALFKSVLELVKLYWSIATSA